MNGDSSAPETPLVSGQFPHIGDLAATLHFVPEHGRIWLAGRRMVLMHARALANLKRELIAEIGEDQARALFYRQGYDSGALDAQIAAQIRPDLSVFDAFSAGPQLHALEGAVLVEPLAFELNLERRHFHAEYLWRNSSECEAHVEGFGIGQKPAGWGQIGYADGYASAFFGLPIHYVEVECVGMGHACCRLVGRTAEEWERREPKHQRSSASAGPRTTAGNEERPLRSEPGWRRGLVGSSPTFRTALEGLSRAATSDASLLITGETGVGKELFARALHQASRRSARPFVTVNCATLSEDSFDAEMFGGEKGPHGLRPGRLERAHLGTIYFKDISALPPLAQAKLARFLDDQEIERPGDIKPRKLDIRIVASSKSDLRLEVQEGRLRPDLFYKLNVLSIQIPPLRDRREDVLELIEHYSTEISARNSAATPTFAEEARSALLRYEWPGNVRELRNLVERCAVTADETVQIRHLFPRGEGLRVSAYSLANDGQIRVDRRPDAAEEPTAVDHFLDSSATLAEIEAQLLTEALRRAGGNKSAASRMLGLSRAQFLYRLNGRSGASGE